jgi:hypothetical protein
MRCSFVVAGPCAGLLVAVLLAAGCLDAASRTQRVPQDGTKCDEAALFDGGVPGAECVVAEDCSAFCCECASAGSFEAQLCEGGRCADAKGTCEDAALNADLCR